MQKSEVDSLRWLTAFRALVDDIVGRCDARVISWAGDGVLTEFASPVVAVRAAYDLQCDLMSPLTRERIGLDLRIGLHLANVIEDHGDILGDGVNVASRIEAKATAGAVYLSRSVFD